MTKQELIDCIHKVDAIYEKLVDRAQELHDLEHPDSRGNISGIDWSDSYTFFDKDFSFYIFSLKFFLNVFANIYLH